MTKKLGHFLTEAEDRLNAWGQTAKTAKTVRKQLRDMKKQKAHMKRQERETKRMLKKEEEEVLEPKNLWDFLSESPSDNYFLKNRPAPEAERKFVSMHEPKETQQPEVWAAMSKACNAVRPFDRAANRFGENPKEATGSAPGQEPTRFNPTAPESAWTKPPTPKEPGVPRTSRT